MLKRRAGALALAAALVALPQPAWAADGGVRLDFESGPDKRSAADPWTSGCFDTAAGNACVHTTGGGGLDAVGHGDGTAVRFPGSGTAVIEVPHDASLNPGRSDFTISATVRLPAGKVKSGANLIQKGSFDSGQWKLQVDGGIPTCRLNGRTEERAARAEVVAGDSIADGEWTTLRCIREGSRLRLTVDGEEVDSAGSADLDIGSTEPLTIGGKHTGGDNDQFRGDLDDVGVDITPG